MLLVTHDLRVYVQANDARVFHYSDSSGLEIDSIVQKRNGYELHPSRRDKRYLTRFSRSLKAEILEKYKSESLEKCKIENRPLRWKPVFLNHFLHLGRADIN